MDTKVVILYFLCGEMVRNSCFQDAINLASFRYLLQDANNYLILIRTLLITTDTWNDQLRDRYRQRLRYVTNLMRRQKKDFESQSERLKFKFGAWNENSDSSPSGWDHMSVCCLPWRMLGKEEGQLWLQGAVGQAGGKALSRALHVGAGIPTVNVAIGPCP